MVPSLGARISAAARARAWRVAAACKALGGVAVRRALLGLLDLQAQARLVLQRREARHFTGCGRLAAPGTV